jgi:hypothetical protein
MGFTWCVALVKGLDMSTTRLLSAKKRDPASTSSRHTFASI